MWFCTDGEGMTKFEGTTYETFTEDSGLPNGNIYCMLAVRKGTFWFGTRGGGVFSFDGQNYTNYAEKAGLANDTVRNM